MRERGNLELSHCINHRSSSLIFYSVGWEFELLSFMYVYCFLEVLFAKLYTLRLLIR